MFKLGNKYIVDIESPWFWGLLVIPATIAIMAYQYAHHTSAHHPAALVSQSTVKGFAVTSPASPVASGEPLLFHSAVSSMKRSGNAVAAAVDAVPTVIGTGPASLPDEGQTAAVDLNGTVGRGAPAQASPHSVAGGVNPGDDAGGAGPSVEISSTDLAGTRATADLASVLEENPYLPVADGNYAEDYLDPVMADSSTSAPCPQVLFRGGNDYAILRLTQMGCEIPDS